MLLPTSSSLLSLFHVFFCFFSPCISPSLSYFFSFFRLRRCAQLGLCFFTIPSTIAIGRCSLHSISSCIRPRFTSTPLSFVSLRILRGRSTITSAIPPLPRRQSKYFSFVLSLFGISMVSRKSLYNSNLISKRFPVFLALSPPPVLSPVSVAGNFLPPFSSFPPSSFSLPDPFFELFFVLLFVFFPSLSLPSGSIVSGSGRLRKKVNRRRYGIGR